MVYFLTMITFGIYGIYRMVSTKEEINSFGATIPTAWLMLVPIANIYWNYKYAEGYSIFVKKDNNPILWFLLIHFVGIIFPALVQSELNKYANQ